MGFRRRLPPQGDLLDNEVVYCSMPTGYETGLDTAAPSGVDTMLRIEKPIYGMAQVSRRWQRTIFPYLLRQGFSPSPSPTRACLSGGKPSRRLTARARRP